MKPISEQLFAFENGAQPLESHDRCLARDLRLPESWFRDAVFENPELVIGACRSAGLTDDDWYPWRKEFHISGVGEIDVLLVSTSGRVAVVETKLASSPELRRKVLAQALDYLTHLADELADSMPAIPEEAGERVADPEDIREAVSQGDVLVLIVSDDVDDRVARLSRSMLAGHLVKQWDLAFVDMALYRPADGATGKCVIVPTVRNVLQSEARQTVRIIVQGESPKARVEVEHEEVEPPAGRQRWNEERFFGSFETAEGSEAVRTLAQRLRDLASQFPETLHLSWGTGRRVGSMVLKRNGFGLVEVFASGELRFRPNKFSRALGEAVGGEYAKALDGIVPGGVSSKHNPGVSGPTAARIAPGLGDAIRKAVEDANAASPDD